MPLQTTPAHTAKVTVGTTDVPGTNWSLGIDGKLKDVSNFRDGRQQGETLDDATLTMTLVWDASDQPTKVAATNLRTGVAVTVKTYVDGTHFFSAPYKVATIGPKVGGMEDVVMMDVTLRLNGSVTYPVDPS